MGISANFQPATSPTTVYQDTDLIFLVSVTNEVGGAVGVAAFPAAEYVISDSAGKVLVSKSMGDGVSIVGHALEIRVPDSELTFLGTYMHQLILTNTLGDKLPPIIQEELEVLSVY